MTVRPAIATRAACDVAPIAIDDVEGRARALSYIWPDQAHRLARTKAAIAIAVAAGTRVERADAGAWLARQLATTHPGLASVVYHSVMWQYLGHAEQARIRDILRAAGADASAEAPLAWLRFEPDPGAARMELRLTLWPSGRERRLAEAQAHGAFVTWFGEDP